MPASIAWANAEVAVLDLERIIDWSLTEIDPNRLEGQLYSGDDAPVLFGRTAQRPVLLGNQIYIGTDDRSTHAPG